MQDAWRAYLELALGLTEASKKRAQQVARKLVGQSGATAAQLQSLAEELRTTGLANRDALTKIVRFEVERTLGAVGLATADEVAGLTARVRELEQQLREARKAAPAPAEPAQTEPGGAGAPAPGKAVTKAAPEKKALARKATAGGPGEKKAAPAAKKAAKATKAAPATGAGTEPEAPAKKTAAKAAKAAPAKKIAAKKLPAPAKKTAAKKLPPAGGTGTA